MLSLLAISIAAIIKEKRVSATAQDPAGLRGLELVFRRISIIPPSASWSHEAR